MNIIQSIMTENPFYTAGNKITVKGLMLHSVGCPQPKASVFVKGWNKSTYTRACVHAFIDGNTGDIYQTLPWNYRGGHCYKGKNGSGNDTHIGVEMCEPACIKYTSGVKFTCSDTATAKAVVKRTYEAAVELFAYLCKEYNLDPLADGVILGHAEGYKRGIASNHGDPEHLWKGLQMGYTMDTFRKAVKAKMGASNTTTTKSETSGVTITLPILSKGKKGDEVKTLQRLLNALGYTDANKKALVVDGSFGNATLYALKAFQKAKGLDVDGYCGKQTWNALLT